MTFKDYLIFFRWKNILMILLIQCLFKYVLFQKFYLQISLDYFHFTLLAISISAVAIAGYIINDINDVKADIINKPEKLFVDKKLTRITAQNLFIGFNAVGLIIGMYLSYHIGHTSYFIIFVFTSLLLYKYAKILKKKILAGNLMVSFIVLFCILMLAVFDIAPATNGYNLEDQLVIIRIFLLFGGFGFFFTFLREVIKDFEDSEGDKAINAKSFPIVLGENKTKIILYVLSTVMVFALVFICYEVFHENIYLSLYLLGLVLLPLLYFIWKLSKASSKKDYHDLSAMLKIIMLFGILSMLSI